MCVVLEGGGYVLRGHEDHEGHVEIVGDATERETVVGIHDDESGPSGEGK